MTSSTSPRDTLWELIKDIKYAMLTTRHANGHLHSRPVTTLNKAIDHDDALWFFVSRGSEPVTDLAAQGQVNLAYAHPGKDSYVSVSGTGAIVDNPAKKQELWSSMALAYFPGGVGDPDLALLCVRITHAHFWDVKENKLTQLYEMAKAMSTGTRPNLGREGEVRIAANS
ncbi:MAG TPA: pyridoxamine 5'-phosphate oxidase family protein [Burkholderiales bacterium]|jgi:general stress protein 26|nr:pyridoxamine 5'-phosphate oxidase family protein [Burkholderiales bacterium]